jgi:copper homeostasis protein CutC
MAWYSVCSIPIGLSISLEQANSSSLPPDERDVPSSNGGCHWLGIERILTSGGKHSAYDAMGAISDLVQKSDGRIVIMAGAGIDAHNVRAIVSQTGVQEIHVRNAVSTIRQVGQRTGALFTAPLSVVHPAAVRNLLAIIQFAK